MIVTQVSMTHVALSASNWRGIAKGEISLTKVQSTIAFLTVTGQWDGYIHVVQAQLPVMKGPKGLWYVMPAMNSSVDDANRWQ